MSNRGAIALLGVLLAVGCTQDKSMLDPDGSSPPDLTARDLASSGDAAIPTDDLADGGGAADADLAGVTFDLTSTNVDDLFGVSPGPVAVAFYVTDDQGAPLPGATVALVGDTTTSTAGPSGAGTITVQSGATRVLRLTKAGYTEQYVRLELPVNARNALFRASLVRREIAVAFNGASSATIAGTHGSRFSITAGSLVDPDGVAVTGTVELAMTPLDVSGRAVRAFPGEFEGTPTAGGTEPIGSLGTVEFVLTQNGKRLNLGSGKTATIDLPIFVKKNAAGAAIASSQMIPLWSLDETTGRWTQEGEGAVITSANSPTGFALRATVSHFSWWNADVAVEKWYANVAAVLPGGYIPLSDFCGQLAAEASATIGGPRVRAYMEICGSGRRGPFVIPSPGGAAATLSYCALVVPSGSPTDLPSVACGSVTTSAALNSLLDVDIPLSLETAFLVPFLTKQPIDQTVAAGQSATFTAAAVSATNVDDTGLVYQWFRDGQAISGATAKSYTTPTTSSADYGAAFGVRVSSSWWSVESKTALLRVNDPAKDRWVDGTSGMDTNTGTQAMPFKTIARALSDQPSGSTVWVADGVYGGAAEGGNPLNDLLIPSGVTLRAINPGNVTWGDGSQDKFRRLGNSQSGTGDAEVIGIKCHQPSCFAWGITTTASGKGTIKMSGVSFKRVVASGWSTLMFVSGGAKVTLEPGNVTNYCDPTGAPISSWIRCTGNGQARLTINGGACDGFGEVEDTYDLIELEGTVATLNGVLLRGGPTRKVAINGGGATPGAFVNVYAAPSELILNDTTLESTAGGLHNLGILLRGNGYPPSAPNKATLNGGAIRGFDTNDTNRNIAGAGILVSTSGVAQLVVNGTTIEDNDTGILVFDEFSDSVASAYDVTLTNASLLDNLYGGVRVSFADVTPMSLAINGGTFAGNGASNSAGALALLGTTHPYDVNVRGATFADNTNRAIYVQGSAASHLDFGTLLNPGNNVFSSTGAQTTNFVSGAAAAVTVQAVGNTWAPSVQGSDASGHYAAVGAGAIVEATGTTSGANYDIAVVGSKLRLAENP